MNNKIDVWNISTTIDNKHYIDYLSNNKCTNTYLLDISKDINSYDLLEQYIYNIALFHFNRLNNNIDVNNNFIEFWWKTSPDTDNFHLDCDEYIKKTKCKYIHPLLSCVIYFNNYNCPTIITDIDFENYKYKEFNDKNIIYMSFPRQGKHLTFDSKLFHGISNVFNDDNKSASRYMLAINLWNTKPTNIDYYNSNNNNSNNSNNKNNIIIDNTNINNKINISHCISDNLFKKITVDKNLINFNLFEKLLYKKEINLFLEFGKLINKDELLIDNITSCIKFVRNDNKEIEELENSLKNKYGNIIDDINEIMNTSSPIKYNRFLQRFYYNNIYSPDICKWIINECELYAINNGGWTIKRHSNYPTTDLPIEVVKPIFNFICESFKTISEKILTSYCLNNKKIHLNYKDVFVVKYKFNEQSYLDLHTDGSFLSFQILLSNNNDFKGGGTYFDDGIVMYPNQGDLIIHSSRIKHGGLPITKGTRYLLVGFIDLNLEVEI
jgi:hypothetical protein